MGSRWPPILHGSAKDFFITVHVPNEVYIQQNLCLKILFYDLLSNLTFNFLYRNSEKLIHSSQQRIFAT
jgi:hypothetical protein